jgi:lipopolysaccharide export system permease protein
VKAEKAMRNLKDGEAILLENVRTLKEEFDNSDKNEFVDNAVIRLYKEVKEKDITMHLIEWHRKYSISLACLILFFIGAPLGAIIRKGGLGMPLVVAIVFFLIFHLLSLFGEKFVKQDILSPIIGMWLAIIVLAPVGIFLTYKAMNDSQLFNKDFYTRQMKKLKAIFKKNNQSVSYE